MYRMRWVLVLLYPNSMYGDVGGYDLRRNRVAMSDSKTSLMHGVRSVESRAPIPSSTMKQIMQEICRTDSVHMIAISRKYDGSM